MGSLWEARMQGDHPPPPPPLTLTLTDGEVKPRTEPNKAEKAVPAKLESSCVIIQFVTWLH